MKTWSKECINIHFERLDTYSALTWSATSFRAWPTTTKLCVFEQLITDLLCIKEILIWNLKSVHSDHVLILITDVDDVIARTTIIGVILCFRALLNSGLSDVSLYTWNLRCVLWICPSPCTTADFLYIHKIDFYKQLHTWSRQIYLINFGNSRLGLEERGM